MAPASKAKLIPSPADAPVEFTLRESSGKLYLIAANRELNSFTFYKSLSDSYPAGDVKDLLTKMANEELKHKEKMEYLYANTAFPQTAGG